MADEATQVLIPKASLPDCAVGETLKIVDEDEENFILETQYEEEQTEAPAEQPMEGEEMPGPLKAVMGQA